MEKANFDMTLFDGDNLVTLKMDFDIRLEGIDEIQNVIIFEKDLLH